jgi:hypothetical protein
MAYAKDPAVVKDDLQDLLQGLAKELNRRIYGEKSIPWGTKFADIEELAVQIGQEGRQHAARRGGTHQPELGPAVLLLGAGLPGNPVTRHPPLPLRRPAIRAGSCPHLAFASQYITNY